MHFNKFIGDSGGGVRGIILAKAEASRFRGQYFSGQVGRPDRIKGMQNNAHTDEERTRTRATRIVRYPERKKKEKGRERKGRTEETTGVHTVYRIF